MYILKNSIKNIGRNRGRTLLISAAMLITAAILSSALTINRAAGRAITENKNKYGSVISISLDIDKIIQGNPDQPQNYQSNESIAGITLSQYQAFAQSDFLKGSSIVAVMPAASATLKAVETEKNGLAVYVEPIPKGITDAVMPMLKLIGDSGTAGSADFTGGLRKITSGRMYQKDAECVVSADLASLNGLHVGDAIAVNGVTIQGQPKLTLTVTGVYSDSANSDASEPLQYSYMDRRNEILTTLETVAGAAGAETQGVSIQAEYYLVNPGLLKTYTDELRKKGLPSAYIVSSDASGFDMATESAMRLGGLSIVAAVAAVMLGGAALILITLAGLKKRRQELAVLHLMGVKRKKLALGLLYETLIIAIVCTFLGLAAGAATAQPAADALMKLPVNAGMSQRTTAQPARTSMILMTRSAQNFGVSIGGAITENTKPENIKIAFNLSSILEAALASLALASVACFAAVRFTVRNEPMNILTKKP